jgi:hypothetical protein
MKIQPGEFFPHIETFSLSHIPLPEFSAFEEVLHERVNIVGQV